MIHIIIYAYTYKHIIIYQHKGRGRNMQEKVAEACDLMEREVELVGVSAVEDKLQVGL